MRTEQFKYLEAIVRCKSFRRAAEELELTEPSLSQQIRRLERDLGAPLLERDRRALRITDFGRAILLHGMAILGEEDLIRQTADEYHGLRKGTLQFGNVHAGSNTVVLKVLLSFKRRYPGVEVRITETGSLDIAGAVLSGELDIGLIVRASEIYSLPAGLLAEDLVASRLVMCAPAGHPLARRKHVSITELSAEPLILFRKGYLMHDTLLTLFRPNVPNIVYITDNAESSKRMVAAGIGITLLPEFSITDDTARREGQIVCVPIKPEYPRFWLAFICRRSAHLSPAAVVFRDMLRDASSTWMLGRTLMA